jgi:hypothetical protein
MTTEKRFTPEHLAACERSAQRLRTRLASRPIEPTPNAIKLNKRHCKMVCHLPSCHLECAVLPERLQWWEAEVKRVAKEAGAVLTHDGKAFPVPKGSA